MPIFLILFVIFFGCGIAQFVLLERIRRALAERHPDVLQSLAARSFFAGNNVYRFVRQRGDRALDDPELTRRVGQFRGLMYATYGAWGLIFLSIVTGVSNDRLTLSGLSAPGPAGAAARPAAAASAAATSAVLPPVLGVPFGAVFAVAFVCNLVYLVLVWRLGARWNTQRLGPPVTMGDPMSLMGVILWSAPASDDATFRRLRLATRAAGLLGLAATLALFAVVIPHAFAAQAR